MELGENNAWTQQVQQKKQKKPHQKQGIRAENIMEEFNVE